ncbi:MAG: zinc ribbon domain-containing protein, partial [Bacilli bacterium]|nr:zinc ribbon domain-containing protein [Bacilli bacterium]
GIPEIDSSILALDTDTSVPSVPLDPIAQMEMEESNTDTVSLNNIYSLEETKNTSNIEEANHDGFILDIDPENNTWQDKVKLTEEELTKKVVTIDSATENVTFTSKEKPVEVANLDKFKICPNCHTKLDSRAKVCFLCGSPIEDRK